MIIAASYTGIKKSMVRDLKHNVSCFLGVHTQHTLYQGYNSVSSLTHHTRYQYIQYADASLMPLYPV